MKDLVFEFEILCTVVRENYSIWLKQFVYWESQIWGSLKIV